MIILLLGGLIVIIGLCLAIETILAKLPLHPDEIQRDEANHRSAAQAAFDATVTQEVEHWREIQRRAARHLLR